MSEDKTYHLYSGQTKGGGWGYDAKPEKVKTLCNDGRWTLKNEWIGNTSPRDATVPQTFTNCKSCLKMYWNKKVIEHNKLKLSMIDKGVIDG